MKFTCDIDLLLEYSYIYAVKKETLFIDEAN